MADKKKQADANMICGLWGANVKPSDYNQDGDCPCINCFGMHCHDCRVYVSMASAILSPVEKTVCDLCLRARGRTR